MTTGRNAVSGVRRFLVINPFGIGDVLFTTPLIRALRISFPDSFIGYWCGLRTKSILENNDNIDIIFALSRGDLKKQCKGSLISGWKNALSLFFQIRKNNFNTVFDFSLDHRYGLVCKAAGIRERIGYDYKGRGRFLTKKLALKGYSKRHVVEYYTDLSEMAGITVKDRAMELPVSHKAQEEAEKMLKDAGVRAGDIVIGIAPGAGESWGTEAVYRRWPVSEFAKVAKHLGKGDRKILLFGDRSEVALTEEIMKVCEGKPLNLAGKTSLVLLAALLKKLDLFISTDGGPMHMAVSLGTKTVSVIGPVDERVYGPYPQNADHLVVKSNLDCRPCYNNFRLQPCQRNKECLNSIDAEKVIDSAEEILKGINK